MGCLNQKQKGPLTNPSLQQKYMQDKHLQNGIIIPLETTLYNILRKSSQASSLSMGTNPNEKLFVKEHQPNLTVLAMSQIKMLYSFKNLVFVGEGGKTGEEQELVKQIRNIANPKGSSQKFLEQIPNILNKTPNNKITKIHPNIRHAINSQQLISTSKHPNKIQIFLHTQQNMTQELYQNMKINKIINDDPSLSNQQIVEHIRANTRQMGDQSVVYLHGKTRKSQDILEILTGYIVKEFGLDVVNAKFYARRCLPQTSINEPILQNVIQNSSTQRPQTKTKQQLTLTQTFQKYLTELHRELSSQKQPNSKLDRSYNLLITLISNIYNNKNSQNYRQVRKNNPQIYQLLSKYKNGVKLLNCVGFVDEGSGFVNKTDVKYLKVYRTDLDMAYRNFINQRDGLRNKASGN